MTTIEKNILIWEFMKRSPDDARRTMPELLQYHKSWDWLMEAIDKARYDIAKIKKTPVIDPQHEKIIQGLLTVDITMTWSGLIEFIEWYNKQK